MAERNRGTGVVATVEHHQYLHRAASAFGLEGGAFHRAQAMPQAPRLVVGGDDYADHGQVSSRSTTLGWHDQYSSRKSASS